MTKPLVSFRLATEADAHLSTYDNTKLVALNTCPTWGVLRYQMHKRMSGAGRAMALECGSAMHEVFAWVRLCTLKQQLGADETLALAAFMHHGERLFGKERLLQILEQAGDNGYDYTDQCKRGAIAVLDTSGFYDDPSDKRRTLSNMEECAFAYIDRHRWDNPVWMREPTDPKSDVGIEIPFDLVVTAEYPGPEYVHLTRQFRCTGKIDGISDRPNALTLEENKTASRLNDAWSLSFAMSSQVTLYCIAASIFTGRQVRNADILGLAIPLPKSYDYGGFIREPVTRSDYHFARWIDWLLHSVNLYEQYEHDPYNAPKYTHSCNRYFRPCSFIPFCDSDDDEQRRIVDEMVIDEWSPLHEVSSED